MEKALAIVMLVVVCVGCKQESLSNRELIMYINDPANGMIHELKQADLNLKASYYPSSLVAAQELDGEWPESDSSNEIKAAFDRNLYFLLSLSIKEKDALQVLAGDVTYPELLNTLSFRMDQFVNITTSMKDTIYVSDFTLNRTYGLSGSTDLIFSFDREKTKEAEWIRLNVYEFGLGTGNQRFRFQMKAIRNVPDLKLDDQKLTGIKPN